MRPAFAPTVLLVDDDPNVTRRWTNEFHTGTSLGVVTANTLRAGRELIEREEVTIDAVVADIFFEKGKEDDEKELYDGIAFLSYLYENGFKKPMFVMSANTEMADYRRRAETQQVPVVSFIDKFTAGSSAWINIQRSVLERSFGPKSDVTRMIDSAGKDEGGLDLLNDALCKLQLPVRTYLQQPDFNPESRIAVKRPIEAICVARGPSDVRAYVPSLGLLVAGRGDDIPKALADLKEGIVLEVHSLLGDERSSVSPYVDKVSRNLTAHIDLTPPTQPRSG